MAHEHNQIFTTVKRLFGFWGVQWELEREVQVLTAVQEVAMICPSCKGEQEMLFSVLSLSFICLNSACGFEFHMDAHDAKVLLQPEEEPILT